MEIVAIHIDYANRPESAAEAAYCRQWCERHGVDVFVRRIDEVTRGVTARDAYEKISRQVRYSFYRETMQRYGKLLGIGVQEIGVVLGHHRGDLRENVLSNAHKGCGPLDLSGMTSVSKNDGIVVYRPLLPLEKSFVLDYESSWSGWEFLFRLSIIVSLWSFSGKDIFFQTIERWCCLWFLLLWGSHVELVM